MALIRTASRARQFLLRFVPSCSNAREVRRAIEVDGHDFAQLISAFEKAKQIKGKPTAIIAKTVKGKGVSFMERNLDFHGKAPTQEEVKKALEELK